MRRTPDQITRERDENFHAAVGNVFGFELQDGALDAADRSVAYHEACAPRSALTGYGWAVEDLRPCAACGGSLGQPPVTAEVLPYYASQGGTR